MVRIYYIFDCTAVNIFTAIQSYISASFMAEISFSLSDLAENICIF